MRKINFIVRLLSPFLLLMPLTGFAEADYLWKKQADYVAVKTLQGTSQHDHPAKIPADKIARILSQLRVGGSSYSPDDSFWNDEPQLQRVFTDREIDLLGNQLSNGFENLKPGEVLVFSVSDYRDSFIGRKRLSVSGTAFIKADELQLLFGSIHADLLTQQNKSGITGTYGRIKNTLDTGNIINPFPHEWKLQPFDGAARVQERPDWLRIQVSRDYEYAVAKNNQQRVEERYFSEKQKSSDTEQLEARINKLEQQAIASKPKSGVEGGLEERLRALQALYNSGALPETVYLEKVRSIMSEL